MIEFVRRLADQEESIEPESYILEIVESSRCKSAEQAS
jgi:hypothetical protein